MKAFRSRPYRLFNKIQNYDWGTKNENAFIPKLLGSEIKPGVPYAELWIGTHPKAPSEIDYDGNRITLNELIKEFPSECLGEYVSGKFNGKFPFLLKVLSADRALSIQTHPDKSQAEKLHAADPVNYPDDNHKPEIAIALDSLTAIAGFKPVKNIKENLGFLPELKEFAGGQLIEKILNTVDEKEAALLLQKLYGSIMRKADEKEKLTECLSAIRERLKNKKDLSSAEEQFLEQYELFGNDIGLLSFFFFNMIRLNPGQAIFTNAGVPHAYIKGNIIECMANSDNVIRAGLTGKFKDVSTLLDIIRYEFKDYEVINPAPGKDEIVYGTKAEEFEISFYRKTAGEKVIIKTLNKPLVVLLTAGTAEVKCKTKDRIVIDKYEKGSSFFIPADLEEIELSSLENSEYYITGIP